MYKIIDMHCDTIPALYERKKQRMSVSLQKNDLHIDIEKLRQGNYLCQCFSLFTYLDAVKAEGITPFSHVQSLAEFWLEQIGMYPDTFRQVKSYQDILDADAEGKIGAIMTAEEGAVYEGKIENLHTLYDMGVRISTLTWNFINELGYPNPAPVQGQPWMPDEEQGLTETGIEFVQEMERLGILVDISHLNDAGIRDVFTYVKGPVIATHSNARAECYHLRNLSDDMIRGIAEHGGVTGINFCPGFLREQGEGIVGENRVASTKDMVRHMKYLKNLGGIDCISLGTDFDGITGELDLKNAGEMQYLADVMSLEGFTSEEIEKVFSKNILRVFRETWK